MTKNKADSSKFDKLRQLAEEIVGEQSEASQEMASEDIQFIIHELQVHQVELEVQNEELRQAQLELEESRKKYFDLFELAPVGYFTLDKNGLILQVNLAGANLLGVTKKSLINKRLSDYIEADYQDAYHLHRMKLFETEAPQTCELKLVKKNGAYLYVQLESIVAPNSEGNISQFRTTITDITERKQIEKALSWEADVHSAMAELSKAILASESLDDISSLVLKQAKRLTNSRFGYVGYIDLQTGYLVCPTMTRDVWDECQVADKSIVFKTWGGLWGWVLENRKSLLTNTPTEDSRYSGGAPVGHIPIRRFLSVPALIGETLIGQLAVANSNRDYTEQDQSFLERLASLYALAIQNMRMRDAMRRSEERYKRLSEVTVEGIAFHDKGVLVDINYAFAQMFGYEAEELIGKDAIDILVLPDYIDVVRENIATDNSEPYEIMAQRKDGTIFPLEVEARNIAYKGNTFRVASVRDITARKQTEEVLKKYRGKLEELVEERTIELREANEQLQKEIEERKKAEEARIAAERELEEQRALSMRTDRLRSLGEMAAGIAHELNQPLVGVRGLAEHTLIGMERGWELTETELQERLTTIIEQADRMSHIIEHIRMFAREAGNPEMQLVQVNDVVESAMEMLGAQFRARGLELKCELTENLPPILANPFSLEEVVLNLIINARDAVEERLENSTDAPLQVLLRTFLEQESEAEQVKIEVVDWGVGIPEEILPNVFDPFFTTKEPNQGTGLGLSISQSIVEQFKGTIDIQSTFGQGTTVTISLPPE